MNFYNRKLFYYLFFVALYAGAQENSSVSQPLFRGDLQKNGVYAGIEFNYIKKSRWQFKTGGAVRSTPVYDKGKVYAGSSDGHLYCIDAENGKELWSYDTGYAVHSSPAISNGKIYFTDKKNILYALNSYTGEKVWRSDLHPDQLYEWGFDYYQSSPMVYDGVVYVGSGNGEMYALNEIDGKIIWKYKAASLVRSSPSFYKGAIYFGDFSGKVYALNAKTGKKKWQFATIGDTINNEPFGNDYKAVVASVALKDNIAIVGGRDCFLYGIDASTGKELWKHDYKGSWVLTSVAIKDSTVVTGTSDGRMVQALNLYTGKEIWKYDTPSTVWASPIIVNSTVLSVVNDGFMYALDLGTGKEIWRYRIGIRLSLSSPIFNDGIIYIGNDDGNISALQTGTKLVLQLPIKKAVFYTSDVMGENFKAGMSTLIRDYFVAEGYELLDESKLPSFLKENSSSESPSVVVFAAGYFQPEITDGSYRDNILINYLKEGGKVVVLGVNPALHRFDRVEKIYKGLDFSRADSIIGITYKHNDARSHSGYYSAIPTSEGKKWGLSETMSAYAGVSLDQVTPLAIDENGRATYWVKNYGHHEGTGFVQLWIQPSMLHQLGEFRKIAEYGID